MICGSVCSGIGAPETAWKPLGYRFAFASEIDKFPAAVHALRHPEIPNLGDMTKFDDWPETTIDVLVGGTPCQSFSVAGLRKGLADPRGNLALTYLAVAERFRPRWVVWENVPGVCSSVAHDAADPRPPDVDLDGGDGPRDGEEVVVVDEYDADESHAFSCFLAGLEELGYGWAYRTLDTQYVRVQSLPRACPQRRRRVFVIGYLGDWRGAAAVLLEPESLFRHPPPRRQAGQDVAGSLGGGAGSRGWNNSLDVSGAFIPTEAFGGNNVSGAIDVATALRAKGGTGHGDFESETFVVEVAPVLTQNYGKQPDNSDTNAGPMLVAHGLTAEGFDASEDGGDKAHVLADMAVRRLTPRECERLHGHEDDYTRIPWRGKPAGQCPDGPRYKALGNTMSLGPIGWVGERLLLVNEILPR